MRSRLTLLAGLVCVVGLLAPGVAAANGGEVWSDLELAGPHLGGLEIMADGVTLNCDGHMISGGGGVGVYVSDRVGVTVKNCVFEGFSDTAVFLWNSSDTTIKHNLFVDNRVAVFTQEGSHSSVIKDNEVVGGDFGILVGWNNNAEGEPPDVTYGNLVLNNRVTLGGEGFSFRYMSDSVVAGNTVMDSFQGMQVSDYSTSNTITGNVITDCGAAFAVGGTTEFNTFSKNRVVGNGDGFFVGEQGSFNTFTKNHIEGNVNGFTAIQGSVGNELVKNWFCDNSDYDVWFSEDSPTIFEDNRYCD